VDIRTALLQGTKLSDRLTAEVLLCHALHVEKPFLYAYPERELSELEWLHFGRYLHERLSGKPTQYITRRQEFYGREFRVTPDVLIPRPETEHLVEASLLIPAKRIVDVGCGSGAIAVTLALESLALESKPTILAVDVSMAALLVTAENASRLGAPVVAVQSDLLSAIGDESVDLVVSNPPYVPVTERDSLQREVRDWEPGLALFAGEDGLDIYRRLILDAWRALSPGGHLALELGYKSLDPVRGLLDGWRMVSVVDDLAGIPRVIVCKKE
jgi:release factor glutamine methyltransferase